MHIASILSTFSEWNWTKNARLRAGICGGGQRILKIDKERSCKVNEYL
jgi:hypothetical protein